MAAAAQPRGRVTHCMAEIEDNVDRELFRNVEKLRGLRIEHRDLDEVIKERERAMQGGLWQLGRLDEFRERDCATGANQDLEYTECLQGRGGLAGNVRRFRDQ